jgi:hypothetical protein
MFRAGRPPATATAPFRFSDLGVRLECAQYHKHPFDRWTQADYRSYANLRWTRPCRR